jgi:hypothetical protein
VTHTPQVLLEHYLKAASSAERVARLHQAGRSTLRPPTLLAALGLPSPLRGPFVSSGDASFDRAGHFNLTSVSSFNGIVQGPATVNGSYSVNSDCT